MITGAITDNIDIAQMLLYAFWLFFFGLVYYLRQEDKREGYPLEQADASPYTLSDGFPARPDPKVFFLPHGGNRVIPGEWKPEVVSELKAKPVAPWPGAPLEPVGDPMLAGVGPGAWANRPDVPDLTVEGLPKIVPLRADSDYSVAAGDPDPRGHEVYGDDGKRVGLVRDLWVDRSERMFRYFEVEIDAEESGAGVSGSRVLLPVNFSRVNSRGTVNVSSIFARHFAYVPKLQNPDQVTLLEEDKICAYFGSGHLYASLARLGPLL